MATGVHAGDPPCPDSDSGVKLVRPPRWASPLAALLIVLSCSTSCTSTGSASVAAKCSTRSTRATISLTKGAVVPANFAKSIGASAGPLHATVCRAIVTAPSASQGPHGCPVDLVGAGHAAVEFFEGKRVVDTLDIAVTGCFYISSTALGGVADFVAQIHNYDVAMAAIMKAFKIESAQLRGARK